MTIKKDLSFSESKVLETRSVVATYTLLQRSLFPGPWVNLPSRKLPWKKWLWGEHEKFTGSQNSEIRLCSESRNKISGFKFSSTRSVVKYQSTFLCHQVIWSLCRSKSSVSLQLRYIRFNRSICYMQIRQ